MLDPAFFTAVLFALAGVLFISNYRWFKSYTDLLTYLMLLLMGVVLGLVRALPAMLFRTLQTMLLVIPFIVAVSIHLITLPVTFVRGVVERADRLIRNNEWVQSSRLIDRAEKMRNSLVGIGADLSEDQPKYEHPSRYREDLSELSENTQHWLDTSTSLLTIPATIVLILVQLSGNSPSYDVYERIGVLTVINIWMVMISILVIVRRWTVDLLAYSGDEEFESLEEMDVALEYQKAVCSLAFVQSCLVTLWFSQLLMPDKFRIALPVIRRYHSENLSVAETVSEAWTEVRNNSRSTS